MPSTSNKQRRLMAAAAHDPKIAKSAGVPQSVAREFNQADARARSPETCQKISKTMKDGYAKGRLFKRFGGRGS